MKMATYNIRGKKKTRTIYGTLKCYNPNSGSGYIKLNLINRYQSNILKSRNKVITEKIKQMLMDEGYLLEDLCIPIKAINRTQFRKPSRILIKKKELQEEG